MIQLSSFKRKIDTVTVVSTASGRCVNEEAQAGGASCHGRDFEIRSLISIQLKLHYFATPLPLHYVLLRWLPARAEADLGPLFRWKRPARRLRSPKRGREAPLVCTALHPAVT